MKISIHGIGYVGLVTGACLSDIGHEVVCFDIDKDKIRQIINGKIPFFEPGLEELILNNLGSGRLDFTDNIDSAIKHSEVQIIAVGTPASEDGSTDLSNVLRSVKEISGRTRKDLVVVIKSTVPMGTSKLLRKEIDEIIESKDDKITIDLASNPEFLKEGDAINDFMKPDRIIIGASEKSVFSTLNSIYISFVKRSYRILEMDIKSAELTKYASNVMLASRVSLMNEFSQLADKYGGNIEVIREAVGMDKRIGKAFLYPGVGYGGSCFPKDIRSLEHSAKVANIETPIIQSIEKTNLLQRKYFANKIKSHINNDLNGKNITFWGFSFKPNTDDIRESPAIYIMKDIIQEGANINAYNPEVSESILDELAELNIRTDKDMYSILKNADALVVCTEWKSFWQPDFNKIKELMRSPILFDGRNIYDPKAVREFGFTYYSIGRD